MSSENNEYITNQEERMEEDDDCDVDNAEEEEEEDGDDDDEESDKKARVYLPGQPLEDGEELVCDESAYVLYHQASTGDPCLSFDIIRDNLGVGRETYPMTCYLAAGTQSQSSHANSVIVMKMSNIHPVKKYKDDEDDSDNDSDEEEDKEKKPLLEAAMIKHPGGVNRLRTTKIADATLAATWSDTGKVYVWNLTQALQAVESQSGGSKFKSDSKSSLFSFAGHMSEGFAMDWSTQTQGRLATGDCNKNIHLWNMTEDGSWKVDASPFLGHTASVEDLQWSPTEANVLASCSVDKSIKIWDVRSAPSKGCKISIAGAHDSDVNVISWNRIESRFLASGGDDGIIKVWDLCMYRKDQPAFGLTPVARFKHHTGPITSIEWNHDDSSVLAASGEDDQLTVWDIAVERDDGRATMETDDTEEQGAEPDVLPQLLFIHQGQKDIKELHWHPQLPGVIISTALDGFNVFRTISV